MWHKHLGGCRTAKGLSLQECLAATLLLQAATSPTPPQGMAQLCWVGAMGVAEVTEHNLPHQVTIVYSIWSPLGSEKNKPLYKLAQHQS